MNEPTASRDATPARSADVLLVSMPVVDLQRPSLGLSLLKARLASDHIACTVLYPVLSFAERVGLVRYEYLAGGSRMWSTLAMGDAVFASAAFPEQSWPATDLVTDITSDPRARERLAALLVDLQRHAHELVAETAADIVARRPRIVGCTSTFQQHVASLALLRRIRELDPSIVTMLGGANCETVMGLATHRAFPWVDYVVSGEADGLITPLCQALLDGREYHGSGVRGPRDRRDDPAGLLPLSRATFPQMDALPIPDFSDYFEVLRASRLAPAIDVGLPVETSRGCWWGARKHCTFCGLNGGGLSFRSKSPARALDEIETLVKRWGVRDIEMVDNILDLRYLDTVVPRLAVLDPPLNLFYEVKSNMTPAHVEALASAGIRSTQPGIESLDSRVLALMDKGARGWQQVLFLRGARQHGIQVSWNILFDFPGEDDAWYVEMAAMLPLLTHLQPPSAVVGIRFDRYSPYFEEAAKYGLRLHPHPALARIYPVTSQEVFDLSYHFERAGARAAYERPGVRALLAEVSAWRQAFFGPSHAELSTTREGDGLRVVDTRPCAVRGEMVLDGRDARVYEACTDAPTLSVLRQRVAGATADGQPSVQDDASAVEMSLQALQDRRLVLPIDGRFLALGVDAAAPPYPYFASFPGGAVVPGRLSARDLAPRGAFERMFLNV